MDYSQEGRIQRVGCGSSLRAIYHSHIELWGSEEGVTQVRIPQHLNQEEEGDVILLETHQPVSLSVIERIRTARQSPPAFEHNVLKEQAGLSK